jgi:tRNA nucleotidyltransferase/poly(A) polymerase
MAIPTLLGRMMTQPPEIDLRALSLQVLDRLREKGFIALWAGGCVRDLLLGKAPKDYDVATDATPEQVRKLFRRTIRVGESFGVVRVNDGPNRDIEVATFRTDSTYSDGRRPDAVTFSTPEMDAKRRDFTINGMFYDPIEEKVLDYVGGREDIEARILRAIGDPQQRFTEDKLRLLRALRFAAALDYAIEPETGAAILAMADQVTVVSAERIRAELDRMLTAVSRVRALQLLREFGLMRPIFAELAETLLDPELGAVTEAVLGAWPTTVSFPLAMAGLLAGVPDREVRVVSEWCCQRLRCSNEERQRLEWLVQHRRDFDGGQKTPMAVLKRRLAHPGGRELLDYCEGLHMARFGTGAKIEECRRIAESFSAAALDPAPLLTGHDLITIGFQPGPRFHTILEAIRDQQLEGIIHSRDEAIEVAQHLYSSPEN